MTGTAKALPPLTLVLGGARSGKSRFSERLALGCGREPVYVATGWVGDEEMAARIARHRADRDPRWRTIEERMDLASVLHRERAPHRVLLIDCLTLWLSTLFMVEAPLDPSIEDLLAPLASGEGPVILVANEVGLGLVPETPLGRAFRDAQGFLNQRVAALADQVVFLAAGLPLTLKPIG